MTKELDEILNPVSKIENADQPPQPVNVGKGGAAKKDEKKAPAKGGAKGGASKGGELPAYESNLPLPTSGVESLILLIDHRIESLPLEHLDVFSKIPVVARDFNLHMYMNRLKTIGH